jgi:hypothetical protein
MRGYQLKRLSEYQGQKNAYEKLWSVSEPDGPHPKLFKMAQAAPKKARAPATDWLCQVCKTRKRNFKLVRCHVSGLGERIPGMKGHYIRACESCAASLGVQLPRAPQAAAC